MSHIFISYSTKDADYAYRLADKLREEGFDVWIDNAELRSSDNWWESIVRALRKAKAFIVIMSPNSRQSRWVQREVTLADNWDKPAFPLLLDGENFEIYVLTQFRNVKSKALPDEDFYKDLERYVERASNLGKDVTTNEQNIATDDSKVLEALSNSPMADDTNTKEWNREARRVRFLQIVTAIFFSISSLSSLTLTAVILGLIGVAIDYYSPDINILFDPPEDITVATPVMTPEETDANTQVSEVITIEDLESVPKLAISTSGGRVYTEPTSSATIIRSIPTEAYFTAYAIFEDDNSDNWLLVSLLETEGEFGWIFAGVETAPIIGNISDLLAYSQILDKGIALPIATPSQNNIYVLTRGVINVRSVPTTNSPVVAPSVADALYLIEGYIFDENAQIWYYIEGDNFSGWIAGFLESVGTRDANGDAITIDNIIERVPLLNNQATPIATP